MPPTVVTRGILTIIFVGLIVTAALLPASDSSRATESAWGAFVWNTFLFGAPFLLAICILLGVRWALMVGVMYGTIGLALDLSTLIQGWSRPETEPLLVLSAISGLLNAVLIMTAGGAFLDVRPTGSGVMPQR
jgi:hypothetical protein